MKSSVLESTLNTRDLGGYHIDGTNNLTKYNSILRSDKPCSISKKDINFLKQHRITTIIDLRTKEEVDKSPSAFMKLADFTYYHFPIEEGSKIPKNAEAVPQSYMCIAHAQNICSIFEVIANEENGVMFNCSAGKDRTGVVSALILLLCGVSRQEVIEDYMITKECLAESFREISIDFPEIDMNIVIPRQSYMDDFISLLMEKYGNIDVYFENVGVGQEIQNKIKDKLGMRR